MINAETILAATSHRPWPLPSVPWFMVQQWTDLLFAHWAVEPEKLQAQLPPGLELDLFDGKAWVGLTPFRMTDIHLRGLPPIPGADAFLEMNLRTYVRRGTSGRAHPHGAPGRDRTDAATKPGVYFFSLDASNLPAVAGARVGLGLPYFWSDMTATTINNEIHYTSHRKSRDISVDLHYSPKGPVIDTPTELERFLTDRYCLYEVRLGAVMRTEIHHPPWTLHKAQAHFSRNNAAEPIGLTLSPKPDLLHFSKLLDVLVFPPTIALN